MRTFLLAAALLWAAPCLAGSIPTARLWSVEVHDDVDGLAAVDGTLYVRRLPGGIRFRLECRVSWPDGSADSRTSVWGGATVDGDIVKGRVEGGEDLVQLPDRRFELRLGDSGGAWESNVPGCPRSVRLP